MNIPKKHRNKAAALAIAATMGVGFEGLRHTVYRDIVGVPTYCVGETKKPNWNHVYSTQECMKIYEGRLEEFQRGVERCVPGDQPPAREASEIDFAYNLGVGTFCHSAVARDLNAGRIEAACDAMLSYDHAGGRKIWGLTRRREAERQKCISGE